MTGKGNGRLPADQYEGQPLCGRCGVDEDGRRYAMCNAPDLTGKVWACHESCARYAYDWTCPQCATELEAQFGQPKRAEDPTKAIAYEATITTRALIVHYNADGSNATALAQLLDGDISNRGNVRCQENPRYDRTLTVHPGDSVLLYPDGGRRVVTENFVTEFVTRGDAAWTTD